MSYRSDVTIAISKKQFTESILLKEFPPALTEEGYEETETFLYWCIESWKWDHRFPEIKEIDDYLDKLEEKDDDQFGFMRMGDDNDDVELRGDPYSFGMGLHRSLYTPVHG